VHAPSRRMIGIINILFFIMIKSKIRGLFPEFQ
jgi:hypothetical protein